MTAPVSAIDEARAFFAAHPHIDAIDMIFTNMCGVPRGKRLRQHEVMAVYENGRFLPISVTFADITGRDVEETGLLWETGDADCHCWPVPGTLVPTPWGGPNAAQFLASFHELDGRAHDLDPRISRFTGWPNSTTKGRSSTRSMPGPTRRTSRWKVRFRNMPPGSSS
jgi:glutamine synthetase